jgi:hypothetical protein
MYIDPEGLLAYPGQIHNEVVRRVAKRDGLESEQTINYRVGWGRADLIKHSTGEVWEVKRDKPRQIAAGEKQVEKYVNNTWRRFPDVDLRVGGTAGTIILPGSFTMEIGANTYFVTFQCVGKGVIAYDYEKITDWATVGQGAIAAVAIGGSIYIIIKSGGTAAPVVVPVITRKLGG